MRAKRARTNYRPDINKTIDQLIEHGFKKCGLLRMFTKNSVMMYRRYNDCYYSDKDIEIFNAFKERVRLMIISNAPSIYLRNLFNQGLKIEHIYSNVLDTTSWHLLKKLKTNDFTGVELGKLTNYKVKIKKLVK